MRAIKDIVIHCSASPNGQRVGVEDIDRWHSERGFFRKQIWRDKQNGPLGHIGYHFVIYTSGTVATGRHLEEIGAHVQGSNAHSIGICMVGTDKFTAAQWASLAKCVTGLKKPYPAARVLGHRDYSPDKNGDGILEPWEWLKTCPGFSVSAWRNAGMSPKVENVLQPPAPEAA
jgi:hypothetical protein